jgi:hypothetical protein
MSPEALVDGVFTTAGDVWAFGVVVWEVTSMAKMPYSLMTNAEVYENVVDRDYRLPQPKECPKKVFELAELCWKEEPHERIGFSDLFDRLAKLHPQVSSDKFKYDKKTAAADNDTPKANNSIGGAAGSRSAEEQKAYDNPDAAGAEFSAYDNPDADGAESEDSFEAERLALCDPLTLEPTPEFYRKVGYVTVGE